MILIFKVIDDGGFTCDRRAAMLAACFIVRHWEKKVDLIESQQGTPLYQPGKCHEEKTVRVSNRDDKRPE